MSPDLGDRGELQIGGRQPFAELAGVEPAGAPADDRGESAEEMAADQLVGVVFHQPRGGRVHVGESARRVAVVNQILRVLDDDAAGALRWRAERPLHPHAGRIGGLRHERTF